jgi:hypothetical protein
MDKIEVLNDLKALQNIHIKCHLKAIFINLYLTMIQFSPQITSQPDFFWIIYFLKYSQWQCKLSFDNSTAMYKDLAGFEPGIFCSGGGRDDQFATPPGPKPDS